MDDRVIMHIDMNAFYASVAQHLDPGLRGKALAVTGDPERRSGIILAKSREAKACGVEYGPPVSRRAPHFSTAYTHCSRSAPRTPFLRIFVPN